MKNKMAKKASLKKQDKIPGPGRASSANRSAKIRKINPIIKVKRVTKILQNHKHRPIDAYGNPGGLINLSRDKRDAIIIGDLHGSIENLKAIVSHEKNRDEIKSGRSILIILGDAVHNDQQGQMLEMESSLWVLDELINLIDDFKDNIIYLRGNHDTFEYNLVKSGVHQGEEFEKFLRKKRSKIFVEATNQFFESLPVFILGKGWVVTHAGPIRNGAGIQELINIADNPDYYSQLLWNRLHELRGTPSLKEYGENDIKKMLNKLGLKADSPFIVGHNPLWNTGDTSGIWRDAGGIKNHYIIYSNIQTCGAYLKIKNGVVEEKFAYKRNK